MHKHTRFCPVVCPKNRRWFIINFLASLCFCKTIGILLTSLCLSIHKHHYSPILSSTEKNGKTLHLLKAKSKATPAGKKRKKVALLGSFESYKDSKK